jgi:uncharacterized protein involved in type VI secretion and phage assembly
MSLRDTLVEVVESLLNRRFGRLHFGIAYAEVIELTTTGCTLRYTSIALDDASSEARIAAPMAGPGRGAFVRPEPGDEVVVAFENGDLSQPVVLASVWRPGEQLPPGADTSAANQVRTFVSKAGHKVTFNDTPGSGGITLETSGGSAKIELTATGSVSITATSITLNNISWNHVHNVTAISAPSGPQVPAGV